MKLDFSINMVWVLAIIFSVLKITDTITWSWWWVLSPIWIMYIGSLVATILFLVGIKWIK